MQAAPANFGRMEKSMVSQACGHNPDFAIVFLTAGVTQLVE
ncbi:hypothetical protein [Trichocoleus sp. FACHB-90]|nr:hypothetical protein [Trichocoleus sp. FACHB-90]